MGGLSSGPGPGICFLTLCLLFLAQQSHSAPVQEDNLPQQSRAQGYYDGSSSELSSGCYYNFQHYGEGDRIITNEPCLNCTCRNRMLMCYLRVCPFTKAIGQNCTIEKKPGQCCPLIVCPEVPVQLLTSSTTTEHSESMSHKTHLSYGHYGTAVGHIDDYGCRINGEFYTNGAQIPGNIDKPCEVCYCIRNRTACIMQECTLQVEGCIPVYEEGLCCPVRYQCDYEYNYNAITTEEPRPTPGLVLTTTSGPFECHHDGKWYADGSSVDTEDPCEHCYCMKGDIVCAVQECKPPFEKDGHNCTAMPPAPGKCCPDSYHCDGNEIVAASETTFRQDRMHKFGRNNANVTMSITSSTSSTDKHHGWNYGTNANEKETPNRFTDEQNKDGTTGEDGHMMITEGIPPTVEPLESGSHHLEGHYEEKPISEGHGVNTDNMLTISQVIHSIVHNQTQLLNQNRLNESLIGLEKPVKQSGGVTHDDKIHFPVEQTEDSKTPSFQIQTDEDGNPLESHSTASELPEDYYGFTGGSSDIYAEHSGRPQTKPTKPSGVAAGTGKPQQGQAIFGEHGHFGRPIKRPGVATGGATFGHHEGTDSYQGTTELPEGWTGQSGKRPITQKIPGMDGTFVMTDEMGNPVEDATGLSEGFTGKPGGSGTVFVYYDEHGRPHKRPVSHKQPGITGSNQGVTNVYEGMTELPEGFTGRPGGMGTFVYYDEKGRPHRRPVSQNQPGGSITNDESSSTGLPEGFTGKPVDQEGFFGEHGRPIKKPVLQKQPGLGDNIGATGIYDESSAYPEGFTGKPGIYDRPGMTGSDIMTEEDEITGSSGAYTGRPGTVEKRPYSQSVHIRPEIQGGKTEIYEGTTEILEGITSQSGLGIYGEHGHSGRPQKKPSINEAETNKDGTTLVEGETKMPGHYDSSSEIFGEHGHAGRPHKKPVHDIPGPEGVKVTTDENGKVIEGTTETVIGQTGKPDSDGAQINYDKHGQPKPGVHMGPEQVMTGYSENPIEGVTGLPEYDIGKPGDGIQISYDKYGRPHLRPVHKKPGMVIEAMTTGYGDSSDQYEGTTYNPLDNNKAPDYIIVYDHHGRPIKMPAHKLPGMHGEYVPTDKDGNPIEGVTEITEGFTGKPGINDYIIYYDQFGRPIKMPVDQKRPGGLNGLPLEDQDYITETPEGHTGGTPGDNEYMIVYDKLGRPIKKPIIGRPGISVEQSSTGKPVEGMTETPESQTGKPNDNEYMIVYDKLGRPIKKPVHGRPGVDVEQSSTGKPVEGMTETPESQTGKPESDDEESIYDQYGRPIKRPIHTKPGMVDDDTTTDKYGESSEGQTGKPGLDEMPEIFGEHGHTGRPHLKKPIQSTSAPHDVKITTDEDGNIIDGVTESSEIHTDKPESDGESGIYDEHGRPKPGVHKKPGEHVTFDTGEQIKPLEDHEITTESPESYTGKPETFVVFFDQYGRPHRRPVHKKPGNILTDEEGNPLDVITGLVSGATEKPEIPDLYGEHGHTGRPFKRPGMTGEDDETVEYEGTTVTANEFSGKPGSHDKPEIFGEHGHTGRPHKRPVTHKEPGKVDMSKPSDEVSSDHQTGRPHISYDEHGRPHMKPVTLKPEYEENTTELPEGQTSRPEIGNTVPSIFGEHGRPHKRPIHHEKPGIVGEDVIMTDEKENPIDGVTYQPDELGSTTRPGEEEFYYGKPSRPQKRPTTEKVPGPTDEEEPTELTHETTEYSGFTAHDGVNPLFGQDGRPEKKPDFHKRPEDIEQESSTDDVQGITKTPDEQTSHPLFGEHGHAGKPQYKPIKEKDPEVHDVLSTQEPEVVHSETEEPEIYYNQNGRPIKPLIQKHPGDVATDEDEKPFTEYEGMTQTTDGYSEKPYYMIVFDKNGRPIKKPIQKIPGMHGEYIPTTDKYGKPTMIVTEMPEEYTGKPESDIGDTVYDQFGHTLKPNIAHIKPGVFHEDGKPVDELSGTTETPEEHTITPDNKEYMIVYDKHGRPIKKPIIGRPGISLEQSSTGKPVEGMTETPESQTGKPESDDEEYIYDKYGRPIKRPVSHKKPDTDDDYKPTDKYGSPIESMTDTTEDHTETSDYVIMYDNHGRPIKMPVHKTPGVHDEYMPPEKEGIPVKGTTEGTTEEYSEKPDSDDYVVFYDQFGRPYKVPIGNKKPVLTDETGKPFNEPTTKPGIDVKEPIYNENGSVKPSDVHKKPGMQSEDDTTDKPTGTTEISDEHQETLHTTDFNIVFDKHGRPIKLPLHKKPGMEDNQISTDKYGRPIYTTTESHTEKPDTDEEETAYDQNGKPDKKPGQKKPGLQDEHSSTDKNDEPIEGTTELSGHTGRPHGFGEQPETPEDHTGPSDDNEYMIVYDKLGRPIKKPVHGRPGVDVEQSSTGKPVEGMTETPESQTGKPESDDEESIYDQYGRPIKRPIHTKPGMVDDDTTTDKYGESSEGQTGKPGLDEMPEIFGEHGHTGRPHLKKPIQSTSAPHDVKVTTDEDGNIIDGVTESSEIHTDKPESDVEGGIYDEHGRPKPGVHKKPEIVTEESGKPIYGMTEIPVGHNKEPESDFSVTEEKPKPQEKPSVEVVHPAEGHVVTKPGIVYDEDDQKPEDEHVETTDQEQNYYGQEIVTMLPEHPNYKPESDSHQILPDDKDHSKPHEKPFVVTDDKTESTGRPHETMEDKKPDDGTSDSITTPVNGMESSDDHTRRPGNDDETMIYGEHGHTGQSFIRPVKPGTAANDDTSETSEGDHTTRPHITFDKDGLPAVQEVVETSQDGHPEEGVTVLEEHKKPQEKPEDIDGHSTVDHDLTTASSQEVHEPQGKPEDGHEEIGMPITKTPGIEVDHTTESVVESSTGKPGPSGIEVYFDKNGHPHQRPLHTHQTSTVESDVHNEVSEEFTGKPETEDISSLSGKPGYIGMPTIKPGDDETHSTEVSENFTGQSEDNIEHYDNQGRPLKKPITIHDETITEESEKDLEAPAGVTEPQLFGEHGRPHKKPVLKPGSEVDGSDGEDNDEVLGEVQTDKPDHDSTIILFGETGRPIKKPIKPIHDYKPEENEIFEGDKATEVAEDDRITGKPEVTKVTEPAHGTGDDHDGTQSVSESITQHPEGIWQYLPPKKPVTHDEPEENVDNKPEVKPTLQTTDGLTVPDEDDEDEDDSLIITTDEPEEETEDVHGHPTMHEGEQPMDTKTKIPEVSGKPEEEIHPTTPGIGSLSQDFTTPGYGYHDSSLPVTDGATPSQPVTHGINGQPDLTHLGPDGVSFPGANVVFDKDGKPHLITGHNSESTPGIGHFETPISTPNYEDKLPAETEDEHKEGSHDNEQPEGITGAPESTPESGSTPGVTIVIGEDGISHIVPEHETVTDVKGKPDGSHPEEEKPTIVPEDIAITEKMPTQGHFPGISVDFIPTFSESSTPNTDNPIMVDGGLNQGSPFDAILDNLANVLRPMQTTEQTEEATESHEEVPGEGDCFVDGKTYPNNSQVPPLSPCHTKCTCISSIIHCLSLKCPSPPEDVSQCTMVQDEKSCCPTYICGETSTSSVEGQEVITSSSEEEHGLAETETPVKSQDEESELTSTKVVTEKDQVEADKSSEEKPHDKDHVTSDDHEGDNHTTDKYQDVIYHTKPAVDDSAPTEKTESSSVTQEPTGIDELTEDDMASTKITEGQKKPEQVSQTKPDESQRPQSGYLPPSFDEHYPSTLLPSYFGTGKPIINAEKLPDHQRPDSDDHILGTDEPLVVDKKPQHEDTEEHKPNESMTTEDDHKLSEEIGESDSSVKVVDQDTTTPSNQLQTKKPFEDIEQYHKPTTIEDKHPSTDEEHLHTKKPGQTITTDEIHGTMPEESSTTKKKPEDNQVFTQTEETDYHSTQRPEDIAESSEEHDQKPSIYPTSLDTSTVTSPEEKPIEEEKPEAGIIGVEQSTLHTPQFDGEKEQIDKKPEDDSLPSDVTESGAITSQKPLTHDTDGTLSEEKKDQKPSLSTDQLEEQEHTPPVDEFGKPLLTGQYDGSEPEYHTTDKVHPSTKYPTDQSTSDEHQKKPEDTFAEDDHYSTMSPEDKFVTGKPISSSEILIDSQKQPESDKPVEHVPIHTMTEKPDDHITGEKPEEDISLVEEENSTKIPHGEPSEETEVKPDFVYPSSSSMNNESELTTVTSHVKPVTEDDLNKPQIDEDSLHTTRRPQEEIFDGHEPQMKPEDDSHLGSVDKETGHFTTTIPHSKPTENVDVSNEKPTKPEESTKRPTISGTDELEQEMPKLPEQESGVSPHPSTDGIMVDGTPDYDFASTQRPQTGHVSHKPQQEEIPEEILLHPTRTPGTFQTHKPDIETDQETSEPDAPMIDETLSTFFPEGFFRPTTKIPTVGADKPGEKPEDLMIHQSQTEKPENTPEGTGKPIHDHVTEVPDNFAEIFGTFRPKPTLSQPDQKPSFEDYLPGTLIFQKPDFVKPDEDLGEHETSEGTTQHEEYPNQYTTLIPDSKPGSWKRPIYSTNGTHFIQYIPFREDEVPQVPQGAILGEPEEGSDGEKYWPIIFVKASTTESSFETQTQTPQQVFNGTHFVQYIPYKDGEKPEVPQGAILGQPIKKPDGQLYWPIIDTKPVPTDTEDEPITQASFPGQIYNGTHFIQYLPYDEGKPTVPEGATLGQPQTAPNGEKYWPIISTNPIPDEEETTTGSVESQPEQIFNGTHFIQYIPFNDDGVAPDIPEDATLGQPQKGPDGQIYWPIINTKPIHVIPSEEESTTHSPPVQVFNGTNFIQYVPFKDGEPPAIPEGATLGQPQKTPDGEIFWPIIYARPQPVKPESSLPGQVFNGTHYIQYVPYEENKKPEVPEDATLGQPQKTPDGQIFWPLIYSKPITTKPEEPSMTTEEPFALQHFNGTHFIQYIPFTEGFEPQLPEEATMGTPITRPDGQKYWPIIYEKLPTTTRPEEVQPHLGQVYNGTNFIKYVPYRPNHKPQVPEEATVGDPVKGSDGQLYWPIISTEPLPDTQEDSVKPQVFNGTHYIQYVPFNEEKPDIPEEVTLGEPLIRPDGQKYWPLISKKPLPGLPITTQIGPLEDVVPTIVPITEQVFNGSHYIQYVPYKPGQRPVIPDDATLGKPTMRPDEQMYWPIIYTTPVPDLPVTTEDLIHDDLSTTETSVSITEQFYNGTHYIQYVPYKPGKRPIIPEDATLGTPVRRPDNQLYWPIIRLKPVPGLSITTQQGPTTGDELPTAEPITEQYFNGTHYIQYVPYKPGQRPVIPEEATLGNPVIGPNNQIQWPIVYLTPIPDLPITIQSKPFEDAVAITEPVNEQFFNGTHYIQYVPYKPGKRPIIPEEATLGNPIKGPNDQMYWPIIHLTPVSGLPITKQPGIFQDIVSTTEPVTEQVFNGSHYIQYVPYKPGQRPIIPDDATLGKPTMRPDEQMYWPIIYTTPVPDLPVTIQGLFDEEMPPIDPTKGQVYNGSHYIQYLPYKPGKRPSVPEGAKLGKPVKGPNDEMYWPIIHMKPVSGIPIISEQTSTIDPTKGQIFNGTHYIQYVPYRPMHRPVVPTEAKLGKPTRGPNGQMYWPIIHLKPVPGIPIVTEKPFEEKTPEKGQYFNGTHYIQYEPYIPGPRPMVPEGAILSHPIRRPDGQMYWPIIRSRPAPGVPINWTQYEYSTPRPEQIFNGTHYIQYLPYNPTQMPEVPEGATLGHPQKGPGGQMYWVLISDKPIPVQTFNGTHVVQYVTPVTPEQDVHKSFQVFNGTHYIQYVPYTPGQRPVVPEGAVLGNPTKGPEGETYWPIIYKKRPLVEVPSSTITPTDGQIFNGTHFIRYVPYNPNKRPTIPEGVTISKPQRRPDGQKYWVISSKTPLPPIDDETVHPGQIYNGTHYIQYVPYNPSQMPQVPDGAVLGHPQKGPEGEMNWVIISDKPLPAQPGTQYVQYVTPVTPEANKFSPGLTHNGTHYIYYVPYKPAQIPHIPNGATLGDLEQGPGGQMYWPIIFKQPPREPIFNGTHYVTFAPQNVTNIESTTKDHPFWDYGQYGATKVKSTTTELYPSWSKPGQNTTKKPTYEQNKPGYNGYVPGYNKPDKRPGGEDSFEAIDEDHLIEYPSGSDYDETQEQPYGPGTCRYAGKVYVSAQQIPRDDPCDFCFCFRSDIICLQQSCPPPIPGCHEEPIQGFCCPRYECHVRMATLLNVTSTTTTTTTTLPPHFLSHVYNGAAGRTGCFVQGKAYRVGQSISSASGPCMDCICGGDGKMKCEPKVCTPEPMVRQMMGSTEKSLTANHR